MIEQAQFTCDEGVIVIPYENDLAKKARSEIENLGGRIVSLENLSGLFQYTQT